VFNFVLNAQRSRAISYVRRYMSLIHWMAVSLKLRIRLESIIVMETITL
jgi:hypothetical protein